MTAPGSGPSEVPSRRMQDPDDFLPLPTAEFQILLALADGTRHGHAIKVDLALRTGGDVVMGPGTLYGALKRMVGQGLIEETGPPDLRDHDERRRYYGLTSLGRSVARHEARRMVRLLTIAFRKELLPSEQFRIG